MISWIGKVYFLALMLVGFAELAHAQSSRKDDIVFNAQGRPMAGAPMRLCTSIATSGPGASLFIGMVMEKIAYRSNT